MHGTSSWQWLGPQLVAAEDSNVSKVLPHSIGPSEFENGDNSNHRIVNVGKYLQDEM